MRRSSIESRDTNRDVGDPVPQMANVARNNDHVSALLGELAGGVEPEPLRAAGDKDGLRLVLTRYRSLIPEVRRVSLRARKQETHSWKRMLPFSIRSKCTIGIEAEEQEASGMARKCCQVCLH